MKTRLIEFLVVVAALLWITVFIYFSYAILNSKVDTSKPGYREYDFWDDVDGGTYVTMSDGEVRLDNDGIVKVKIANIRANAGSSKRD